MEYRHYGVLFFPEITFQHERLKISENRSLLLVNAVGLEGLQKGGGRHIPLGGVAMKKVVALTKKRRKKRNLERIEAENTHVVEILI